MAIRSGDPAPTSDDPEDSALTSDAGGHSSTIPATSFHKDVARRLSKSVNPTVEASTVWSLLGVGQR